MEAGKEQAASIQVTLSGVKMRIIGNNSESEKNNLTLTAAGEQNACRVSLTEGETDVFSTRVSDSSHFYRACPNIVILSQPQGFAAITTSTQRDASDLLAFLEIKTKSSFSLRTEWKSASQYFHIYGFLSQQQNMLQDEVRTSTYRRAILENSSDFKDKVVLDVGAGSGILSFFAIQAGARKVYSVEASDMATHCRKLVKENNWEGKMEVIEGKVEEVEVPEKVDMIVSEPLGYLLYNERMIESYMYAKKWLKDGGNMFPTQAILYVAPFYDEDIYSELDSKATFWTQKNFRGVNISSLLHEARKEYFRKPVKDIFDEKTLTAEPVSYKTNFLESDSSDLHDITIPLKYKMPSGICHGLAFWFDCDFIGSEVTVVLSTAPSQPPTHWHQIRLLLPEPLTLKKDQLLTGSVLMQANEKQSYNVAVRLDVAGTDVHSTSSYDLKSTYNRFSSLPGIAF